MIRSILSRIVHGPPSEEARLINAASAFARHVPHSFAYRDLTIACTDFLSVAWQIAETFGEERIRFEPRDRAPLIIDCGANVGITALYQQQRHPRARIIAYEPDPKVFACLERNLRVNGAQGVEARRAAVWVHSDGVSFNSDGADGGSVSEGSAATEVPSLRLREELLAHERIDLLKIDIEGAETDVLVDCGDVLQRVDRIFVEYHSHTARPQRLHELLAVLTANGFRYHLRGIGAAPMQPFLAPPAAPMDLQLDIHAFRS